MSAISKARAVITTPSDTQIVITREFDAPRRLVFEAMSKPEHIKRWWGLRAWTNHVCEVDLRVGGRWRFGQRGPDGEEVIFSGEYREIDPPGRMVHTEVFEAVPDESSLVTTTLDEHDGKTTLTAVCEYSSREVRDAVIASGMETGAQESYDRLDEVIAEMS
jgi:uncharacterized protein YndB with AHSA1/START domain